jgi:hypothetical protein
VSRLLAGIAVGIVYLAAALALVLVANDNGLFPSYNDPLTEQGLPWMIVLAVASVAFGWIAGLWSAVLLALVSIPLAVPFDYPDHYPFAEPLPVWFSALVWTPISAALILLGVGARKVRDRRRKSAQTQEGVTQA